jgi:hypothetical protein
VSAESVPPKPSTIHKRFGLALLREALSGAGKVQLGYRVDNEPEWVHGWAPRRSANDPEFPPSPDPDPKKWLSQGILGAAMDAAGMVPLSVQIGTEPSFIDFYFEPDPSGVPAPGLLGKMTRLRSILSPLHTLPCEHDVRDAIRVALDLWMMQGREARKARVRRPKLPVTWLISTAFSDTLKEGFGLEPKRLWPAGVYFGPPALALHAIVLRELPATGDTLLLRLLGTGDVLENALAEQAALPVDALERCATRAALKAVSPADDPVPIEETARDPVLHACRKTYRRWARVVDA